MKSEYVVLDEIKLRRISLVNLNTSFVEINNRRIESGIAIDGLNLVLPTNKVN